MAIGLLAAVTNPVYPDPSTLHVPLTANQRALVEDYLDPYAASEGRANIYATGSTDQQLIDGYKYVWKYSGSNPRSGGGYVPGGVLPGQNPNAIPGAPQVKAAVGATMSVADFLGKLSDGQTWVRVAEFTAGVMLVGIGIHAVLQNNSGYQKSISGPLAKAGSKAKLLSVSPVTRELAKAPRVNRQISAEHARTRRMSVGG